MNFKENSDEIVIRHAPVGRWVSGGILTFIFGISCLWLILNARGFYISGIDEGLFLAFMAIGALLAFFGIKVISMIFAPLVALTISQKTKSVDISSRRFYGSQTKRFYFTQIKKFKSYKSKLNFISGAEYFLALVLANQKTLKLEIPIGDDKRNTVKLVKKLNKFVKSQAAAKENIKSHSI